MQEDVPPSPAALFGEILARFGLEDPQEIRYWPNLEKSNQLLACFSCNSQPYLLKARPVEHRGTKALYETQQIQMGLRRLGIPVPALHAAPGGETLVPGPDHRDEADPHYEVMRQVMHRWLFYDSPAAYWEIQQWVPGGRPAPEEQTAHRVGAALARFHLAGRQPVVRSLAPHERHLAPPHIDTHLLNKALYIQDFIRRGAAHRQKVYDYIRSLPYLAPEERRLLDGLFVRRDTSVWQRGLSWGIVHGNCCPDNVVVDGEEVYLIDFDEAGLGPLVHDLGEYAQELEAAGLDRVRAFLRGYVENGGELNAADRTALIDGLMLKQLAAAAAEERSQVDIAAAFEAYRL